MEMSRSVNLSANVSRTTLKIIGATGSHCGKLPVRGTASLAVSLSSLKTFFIRLHSRSHARIETSYMCRCLAASAKALWDT